MLSIMEKQKMLRKQSGSHKQQGRSCQIYIHFAALI